MTVSQINGLILIDCWEPDEYYPPSKLSKRQGKTKHYQCRNDERIKRCVARNKKTIAHGRTKFCIERN